MGNSAKRSARAIGRAGLAKRCAELRIAGKTWRQIGDELHIAASSALRAVDEYTADLPHETTETLRNTLLARAEDNYANAFAAREALKSPKDRLDADAKIATILEKHARIGRVIQEAAPVVTVTQSQGTLDVSRLAADELPAFQAMLAKMAGQSAPVEVAPPALATPDEQPKP